MLKATLLNKKPNFKPSKDSKKAEVIKIEQISKAIDRLGLKYKRVDEMDIYNIIEYLSKEEQ